MAFCLNCGSQLTEGATFCANCGASQCAQPQKRICPNCRSELAENMMFCDKCGARYAEQAPPAPVCAPNPYDHAPQPTPYQGYVPGPSYTGGHNRSPVVDTGTLTVLSVICIFFWPVAIYGFVCRSRAKNALTQTEADEAVQKGTRACVIAIVVMAVILVIGLAAGS